jgi:hypothetical protein
MSATPRAKNEYSRGSGLSDGGSGGDFGGREPPFGRRTLVVDRGADGLILAGTVLAALLLVVAEFTALYQVHIATSSLPLKSVSGGSNHSYAMLVIGLAAGGLGIAVWRSASRPALLALGVLGVVAILIALLGDLPDSQATGLAGSASRGYVNASSTPSAGLYLETLGAILLILTCGLGFMTLGPARPGRPGRGDGERRRRGPGPPIRSGESDAARSGENDAARSGENGRAANGKGRPGERARQHAWARRRRPGG